MKNPFKGKKFITKKRIKIVVLIIIALLCIKAFLPKSKSSAQTTFVVKKEVSQNKIQIAGYINAAEQQQLLAPGEGIVEEVAVKEGDQVKKGALIFKLDNSKEIYNLANQDFLINQERINGASQKLKLMQTEREFLQKQLDDRAVRAKFNGIVGSLSVSEGQYAKAQNYFGALIDRSFLKATVEVVETDASRLAVNQPVLLEFPAQPDIKLKGRVITYPSVARISSRGITVLDVEIRVDNVPDSILPGYSFMGTIIAGDDEEILIIEKNAIQYKEGKPLVTKGEGKETETIPVIIEPYTNTYVKIIEGLEEGDVVQNDLQ